MNFVLANQNVSTSHKNSMSVVIFDMIQLTYSSGTALHVFLALHIIVVIITIII